MNLTAWLDAAHTVDVTLTLLHFLWQGALIAGLVAAANLLVPARAASIRYGYSFLAFLAMALCLPVTYAMVVDWETSVVVDTSDEEPVDVADPSLVTTSSDPEIAANDLPITVASPPLPTTVTAMPAASAMPTASQSTTAPRISQPSWLERSAPYVIAIYAIGVILMLLRLALALGGGYRLRRDATPIRDRAILDLLARKGKAIGLRALPAIAYSQRIAVPMIVGVLRPVILLPTSILTELTTAQVEAVLVHELAHLRRWDHMTNVIQRVIESVVFFHPAAWYVSRCISRERENCCDDMVLAGGTEATSYAELLVRVSELSQAGHAPNAATLAASGAKRSRLRDRIVRMLAAGSDTPVRLSPVGVSAVLATILLICVASVYIHVNAATAENDSAGVRFEKAHVHYLSGENDQYRKVVLLSSSRDYKRLLKFFPDVGENRPGEIEAGWTAPLIIEFERDDGTRHRVDSDLVQFWNEGNGDRPIDDVAGLETWLNDVYYPGRYVSWVEFANEGNVELTAACRHPFGKGRWWGPEGIGCGFEIQSAGGEGRSGRYLLSIIDRAGKGRRHYKVDKAIVANVTEMPRGVRQIEIQPLNDDLVNTSLEIGIEDNAGKIRTVAFHNIRLESDDDSSEADEANDQANVQPTSQPKWGKSVAGFQTALETNRTGWVVGGVSPLLIMNVKYQGESRDMKTSIENTFVFEVDGRFYGLWNGQTGSAPSFVSLFVEKDAPIQANYAFRFVTRDGDTILQMCNPDDGTPIRELLIHGYKDGEEDRIDRNVRPDFSAGKHRFRIGFRIPVDPPDKARADFSFDAIYAMTPIVEFAINAEHDRTADIEYALEHLDPEFGQDLMNQFLDPDLRVARMYDSAHNGGTRLEQGQAKAEHYYLAYLKRVDDPAERSRVYARLSVLFSTNWHRERGEQPDYPKARRYAAAAVQAEPNRISDALIRARGRLSAYPDQTDEENFRARLAYYKWLTSWDETSARRNWIPLPHEFGREDRYFPSFYRKLQSVIQAETTNLTGQASNSRTPHRMWTRIVEVVPDTPAGEIAREKIEGMWGKPQEGIQALLSTRVARWPAGKTPELYAHVRNRGEEAWWIPVTEHRCEIEVDGKWYQWRGSRALSPRSALYKPGESYENTSISLSADWQEKETSNSLSLAPGRHEIRVAYLPFQHDAHGMIDKTIRVVSQAVTIEIAEQAEEPARNNLNEIGPLEFRIVPNAIGSSRQPIVPLLPDDGPDLRQLLEELTEDGPLPGRRRNDDFQWYLLAGKPTPPMVTGKYRNETYVLLCGKPPYAMAWDGKWALEQVNKSFQAKHPAIEFRLNKAGGTLLNKMTEANLGNHLAVIVDGRVVASPVIRSAISARGIITGSFSEEEIDQMVKALSAGVKEEDEPDDGRNAMNGQAHERDANSVLVEVAAKGDRVEYRLDGKVIAEDRIKDELQAVQRERSSIKLLIRADREVLLSYVATVIDRAKELGINNLQISTRDNHPWGEAADGIEVRTQLVPQDGRFLPVLKVEVRNVGEVERIIVPHACYLLVSTWAPFQKPKKDLPARSYWYEGGRIHTEEELIRLKPGQTLKPFEVALDNNWTRDERPAAEVGGTPRKLSPEWDFGRHAVQFGMRVMSVDAEGQPIPIDDEGGLNTIATGPPTEIFSLTPMEPVNNDAPDNNDANAAEEIMLWPSKLDRSRLFGIWLQPNGGDQVIVLMLNGDDTWRKVWIAGTPANLGEVKHVVGENTPWKLEFHRPNGLITPSIHSLTLGKRGIEPDGGSSLPVGVTVASVTSDQFRTDGMWNMPGPQYRWATTEQAIEICRKLDLDHTPFTSQPKPELPAWPRRPLRDHLVGTWVLRTNEKFERNVMHLGTDGTWWKAHITGSAEQPRVAVRRQEHDWSLVSNSGRHFIQFGEEVKAADGSVDTSERLGLVAILPNRIVGGVTFASIAYQPTYDRAAEEDATRYLKLVGGFR